MCELSRYSGYSSGNHRHSLQVRNHMHEDQTSLKGSEPRLATV